MRRSGKLHTVQGSRNQDWVETHRCRITHSTPSTLTGDARLAGSRGARLAPSVALRPGVAGRVPLLTLAAAGGVAAGRRGRLVAAVGAVAVTRLRAGGRARGADVGDNPPWRRTERTTWSEGAHLDTFGPHEQQNGTN